MDVIGEIERREKRLQAMIEISEEMLARFERSGFVKGPRVKDYSVYYITFLLAWMLVGFAVMFFLLRRTPTVHVSLLPYLLVLLFLTFPLLYYAFTRKNEESHVEFEEKERMARILLERFYKPLKEAILEGNLGKVERIANEILDDPLLAEAMEKLHEGDPKEVAYALLLYAKYDPSLESEVESTIKSLNNRAIRALLESLLRKGYNLEEHRIDGGSHEARGFNP